MVTVEIRGKQFPLCLTVAALDKINEKCGSLDNFMDFLKGGGDMNAIVINTAWALALLMAEGEENRMVCAILDGSPAERCHIPDETQLFHLMTPRAILQCRNAVLDAINESFRQDIEAENPKNADRAGQG